MFASSTTSTTSLSSTFGGSIFSRLQARRAGLEAELFEAEAAGLATFVRCAGVDAGLPYHADRELFRMHY